MSRNTCAYLPVSTECLAAVMAVAVVGELGLGSCVFEGVEVRGIGHTGSLF